MKEIWEVEVTCPDGETAAAIGRAAVEARLAACANIGPALRSLYRWEGALADEGEVLLRLKTRAALFEPLAAFVAARHPYAVPAILGLRIAAATPAYAAWVAAETGEAAG